MKNHVTPFESFLNEGASAINPGNAKILSHKVLNKMVDMGLIPVRKKSMDLVNTIADVLTDAKLESIEFDASKIIEDVFEAGEVSPDQILAPADKKRLKNAFENVVTGIDKLTFKKNGTIEGKRGYFYRHGATPQGVADNLKSVLAGEGIEIEIVDAYDDFKPWPKDSNFVVVFRINK